MLTNRGLDYSRGPYHKGGLSVLATDMTIGDLGIITSDTEVSSKIHQWAPYSQDAVLVRSYKQSDQLHIFVSAEEYSLRQKKDSNQIFLIIAFGFMLGCGEEGMVI